MPSDPPIDDVSRLFRAWQEYQRAPDRCRLTDERRKLIAKSLKGRDLASLSALVEYAFESNASEARFWRGENDRKQEYLDLSNLLVASKLDGRIERALAWLDRDEPTVPTQVNRAGQSGGVVVRR